jgi:hypothetical protein
MRYFWRFVLLATGFAFTTAGIVAWRDIGFRYDDLWPLAGAPALHPLHLLAVGLGMIPLALWEILLLERRRQSTGAQAPLESGYRVGGS